MRLFGEHEQIVVCSDRDSGLRAIIAIHDTTLGPGLGGIRMWTYASDEAALTDVLRLSEGMTYKNALAGLDLGGGKTVVVGDPRTDKTPEQFQALIAPVIPQMVEGIHGAFSLATAQTFWLGVVGAGVAAVAALAIKEIPLRATNDAPVPTVAIDEATAASAPSGKPAPSAE